MIKLKDLLKESSPGFTNRKFGDPLPTLKDIAEKHQRKEKQELTEGIDLYSHIHRVKSHLAVFKQNIDHERGGSFEADSYEYEKDRWENDSKMLKARDKKLGQWEKKVNKALDSLMKDYKKVW